ncbi:MAG: M15 family metallopeptidase [Lewinellaceae bacterium]|nr:M15 family metallopeptidase [Saprospiraceae bacterium]MCB9338324.1 M15 family metallopeptidase [Lewinellaceae bacterium]
MKYAIGCLLFLALRCGGSSPHKAQTEKPGGAGPVVAELKTEDTGTAPSDTVAENRAPAPSPAPPDYDTAAWAEIIRLDPTILLDLRYATANNFVKEKMYDCPRCFLRPEVARALLEAQRDLQKQGLGLKMYDCYRPRPIQWKLWNKVPDPRYVADPRKGSMHNRGMAVDLTIVDAEGKELDMGTDFDYFGKEAYHSYTDHPETVLGNRKLLVETLAAHHFRSTSTEWWHYSYIPKTFPLDDWIWKCK